jgi:hypothetical protein
MPSRKSSPRKSVRTSRKSSPRKSARTSRKSSPRKSARTSQKSAPRKSNKCYASIKYHTKKGMPSQQEISKFINLYVKGTLKNTWNAKSKVSKPELSGNGWVVNIEWDVKEDHLTTKKEKNKLVLKDLLNPDDDGNFPIINNGNEYLISGKLLESSM